MSPKRKKSKKRIRTRVLKVAFRPNEKADLQSTLSMPVATWCRGILIGINPSQLISNYYGINISRQYAKICNNFGQISSKIHDEQCFGTSNEKMQVALEALELRRILYRSVIYNFGSSSTNRTFDESVRDGCRVSIYVSDNEREQIYQLKASGMTFTKWARLELLNAYEMTKTGWSKSEAMVERMQEIGELINQIARKVNTDAYYNIPQNLPEIVFYLGYVRDKAESLLCDIAKSS